MRSRVYCGRPRSSVLVELPAGEDVTVPMGPGWCGSLSSRYSGTLIPWCSWVRVAEVVVIPIRVAAAAAGQCRHRGPASSSCRDPEIIRCHCMSPVVLQKDPATRHNAIYPRLFWAVEAVLICNSHAQDPSPDAGVCMCIGTSDAEADVTDPVVKPETCISNTETSFSRNKHA